MGEAAAGEEIPSIGVGMLGYAFMGKAHSNALKLAYMTWPPPYSPRLVAIAGRSRRRSRTRPRATVRAVVDRLARRRGDPDGSCSTTTGRTTSTSSRRSRPPRPGSTSSARSRSAATPTRAWRSGSASPVRREGHVRVQLPLRPGDPAGPRHDRRRRARRDLPLPWALPPGLGRPPGARTWRLHESVAGSGALGDLGAHVVDLATSSSAASLR